MQACALRSWGRGEEERGGGRREGEKGLRREEEEVEDGSEGLTIAMVWDICGGAAWSLFQGSNTELGG